MKTEPGAGQLDLSVKNGRGERIRTSGLYVPNVALYQAKLHPDFAEEMRTKTELLQLRRSSS